jgi:integrase
MQLTDYVGRYLLARDCGKRYAEDLAATVRQLEEFAGQPVGLADLTDDLVNRWLASLKDSLAPRTIKNKRTSIVVLWRAAFEARLVDTEPKRIRSIKVPETIPVAFLREELLALIRAAEDLKGEFRNGTSKRLWWSSYFHGAYDTGLRMGDLLSLEIPWIWPGGYISIVQSKTGNTHRVQLRDETVALVRELCGKRKTGLIWPLWARREQFFWWFRQLRKKAGIEHGTSKWIRRSSASYLAAEHGPEAASQHLGHKSRGLAEKHYLDPRVCSPCRPLPPPLLS